jgi:outer membrane protein assembly factor BamB
MRSKLRTALDRARLVPFICLLLQAAEAMGQNWPSFRGPDGGGIGDGDTPVSWDIKSGSNVLWSAAIEGLANSSPIIWGDRVFLTTAVSSTANPKFETDPTWGFGIVDGDKPWTWKVICLEKSTGKRIWEKVAYTGLPKQKRHTEATQANCTPATDGRYVVAMFGSQGMFCYSIDGDLVWNVDFGVLRSGPHDMPSLEWGFSSSPIIADGKVIMQCDVLEKPFLAVLDLGTGKEVLRIARDDWPSWTTPTVLRVDAKPQVICNGYKHAGAYDLATGKEVWSLAGRGDIPVPRPIVWEGMIFLTSNHGGRCVYAINASAQGKLTPGTDDKLPAGLAWWNSRLGSYLPTPLVYDGILFLPDERGMVSALDARTGQEHYKQQRWVEGEGARYYASPVAAGGKLYQANIPGTVHILHMGKEYEKLASNTMGETCYATPAISEGHLFVRTRSHLYCMGRK